MKTEQPILITSIKAAVDIPKNIFVSITGNISDGTNLPIGVSNDSAIAGDMTPVAVNGIALVQTGATPVTALTPVSSDANGLAIPSTDASLTRGIALDDGTESIIRVLLR